MHTLHFVQPDKFTEILSDSWKISLTFDHRHGIKMLSGIYICTLPAQFTHKQMCKRNFKRHQDHIEREDLNP